MSQRIKRAQERKQNISESVMATGGHVVGYSRRENPNVRVPQKTTGQLPAEEPKLVGLAKASPFFKPLKDVIPPASKEEEKKVIAESTTKEKKETEEGDGSN